MRSKIAKLINFPVETATQIQHIADKRNTNFTRMTIKLVELGIIELMGQELKWETKKLH